MTDGNFIDAGSSKPARRDVYLYFDNTDKRRAPDDARGLMRRLGVAWKGAR